MVRLNYILEQLRRWSLEYRLEYVADARPEWLFSFWAACLAAVFLLNYRHLRP